MSRRRTQEDAAGPVTPATSSGRRDLVRALQPHKRLVIATGLLSAVSALSEIGVIAVIATFGGRLMSNEQSVPVLSGLSDRSLIIVGGLIVAIKVVADLGYASVSSRTLYRYESHLRKTIAEMQARCAWSTIEDSESGSIHSLLWTSVHRSREGFSQAIAVFTNSVSLVIMLVATVLAVQWTIVPVLGGLAVFMLAFRPLISASRRSSREQRTAYLAYARELNESIAMAREARVLGIQDRLAARLADAGDKAARSVSQQAFYSSVMGTGYSNALYVGVIIGFGFIAGSTVTDPAPLAALVLLLYRSMGYGRALQSSLQGVAAANPFLSDVHRWLDDLEQSAETDGGKPSIAKFETIEFDHVDLTYPDGHVGVEDISFRILHGDSVALVGPSGSGKSSLITMLLALRDHSGGDVRINGSPMEDIDRRSWRRHLALVPQDNRLFDDTVEENVRCWRDISDQRIHAALRQANVLDELLAMEGGLGARVGEGGKRLSGGQRQRVCLARALAGEPDILILDEPTSALDPVSERAVKDSLEALKGEVTLVIIAHRMTTITICDRVMVLGDGLLQHDGSPAEVAKGSAYFARALALSDGL